MTNEIKIRYLITAPKGAFRDIDAAGGSKFVYCTITQIEGEMTIISHKLITVLARELYLGINDRNDKEIYEGDIVATNYPSFPKGVVEYYYGEYVLRDGAMVMPIAKLRRFDWRLEVVGHIYDKSMRKEVINNE